jgi:hypothetical protein
MAASDDFGDLITRSARLWKENLGDLVLLSLVFLVVVWIPIANVGFIAGYTRAILAVARGGKARVGDIFGSWDCFGDLFLYLIIVLAAQFVLNHLPFLGQVAGLILSIVVTPGMYAIIDRKMKFMDAFRWSFQAVQGDFVNWLLAVLVGAIFSGCGALLFGVGVIITLAWGSLLVALQYDKGQPPRVIIL